MSIVGRVFPRLQLQSIKDLATLDLVLLVCDQPLSGSTVLRVSLGGRSVLYPHHVHCWFSGRLDLPLLQRPSHDLAKRSEGRFGLARQHVGRVT